MHARGRGQAEQPSRCNAQSCPAGSWQGCGSSRVSELVLAHSASKEEEPGGGQERIERGGREGCVGQPLTTRRRGRALSDTTPAQPKTQRHASIGASLLLLGQVILQAHLVGRLHKEHKEGGVPPPAKLCHQQHGGSAKQVTEPWQGACLDDGNDLNIVRHSHHILQRMIAAVLCWERGRRWAC